MSDAWKPLKAQVAEFWNRAACGEGLYLHGLDRAAYDAQARVRYELEPFIAEFARFEECRGLRVLEIGVGLGADHQRFAEAGAELYGIDLTDRAVAHTRRRLALFGCVSHLAVGDAEALSFREGCFDVVYSWGVLHHTPDTPKAVAEVHRVLNARGTARVMMYHKWSLVGLMLWLRYALLACGRGGHWGMSMPGTSKAREPRHTRSAKRGVFSPPSVTSVSVWYSPMAICWSRVSASGTGVCF